MIEPAVYDNEKRFIFSNWTRTDFVGVYGGAETLIKSGSAIELPMHKAYLFTKHLVDREMILAGKENSMSSQEARQHFEDRTIAEINGSEPQAITSLKEKIEEEIQVESGVKKAKKIVPKDTKKGEVKVKEFEDIK